jgi:hypothetical protein
MGVQIMTTIRSGRLIAAPALLIGLLASCAGVIGPSAAPPNGRSVSPDATEDTVALKVFFLMHDPRGLEFLVPVQRTVPQTDNLAAVAIRELLAGPTADERSGVYPGRRGQLASLSTAVPRNTELLGVDIQNGVVTVNLSGEFGTSGNDIGSHVFRQAQIVYTLTQFPMVVGVAFRLDGKPSVVIEGHEGTNSLRPATRNLYFDQRNSVFVEVPASGASVSGVVRVAGETTRDADLRLALIDGATDTVITEQTVHASCHPCVAPDAWGRFEARLALPPAAHSSDLRLRTWEPPYREGDPPIVVDYPLVLSPD